MALILASASPRRQELLNQIGCSFKVITSGIIEDNTLDMLPADLAVTQAKAKALDVAAKADEQDVIIGADTIVVVDGQVFGKPVDVDDARRMLTELSGREHEVITGVTVVKAAHVWAEAVTTVVKMRALSVAQIERYIATGEPMDKAGAYAIQGIGALLIEGITGCYTNVVGLPLTTLARMLEKAGVRLL